MYRREQQILLLDDFFLPFGGKLNKENRWVKLAQMIPWWRVEEQYGERFKSWTKGQQAYPVRVALGALIIQERLSLSDRETVHPYLQYFTGLSSFQEEPPFQPSLMTHSRKRLGPDVIHQVNEWIVMEQDESDDSGDRDDRNLAMQLLVTNLERRLRLLLYFILARLLRPGSVVAPTIS